MQRIGLGHDTHRLKPGDYLMLGGVRIPHHKQFVAHSDGDVVLHALIDALLGALAWGDIGELYPDTDPKFANADSALLTEEVALRVRGEDWKIANLDCTIFAQLPKLSPYKTAIRQRVAEILGITVEQVCIKAKTGEHVGPIGREEAISAQVIVLLEKS